MNHLFNSNYNCYDNPTWFDWLELVEYIAYTLQCLVVWVKVECQAHVHMCVFLKRLAWMKVEHLI